MPGTNFLATQSDANGRTVPNQSWDAQNHQFAIPQAGAGTADSVQSGVTYAPLVVSQVVGTPVYATVALGAATGGNVTLAASAGKFTYINGFYVMIGHTASTTPNGQVTLSLDGGTTTHMNFLIAVSATVAGLVQVVFPDPIPAIAVSTGIKITAPSLAAAGIGSISAFGYQL